MRMYRHGKDATTLLFIFFFSHFALGAFVPGYSVVAGTYEETEQGIYAQLALLSGSGGPYGQDFQFLDLTVIFMTNEVVRVRIEPSDSDRWRVPEETLKGPIVGSILQSAANTNYQISIIQNPFSLSVVRKSNGEVLFNSAQSNDPQFNGLIVSFKFTLIFFFVNSQKKLVLRTIHGMEHTSNKYTIHLWLRGASGYILIRCVQPIRTLWNV